MPRTIAKLKEFKVFGRVIVRKIVEVVSLAWIRGVRWDLIIFSLSIILDLAEMGLGLVIRVEVWMDG